MYLYIQFEHFYKKKKKIIILKYIDSDQITKLI